MVFQTVDARLVNDPSTQTLLFSGKFTGITSITMQLSPLAKGTANFAIFENNVQKVAKDVTANGTISWEPEATSEVEFYVNYYDASDMAQAFATVS